MCLSPLSPSIVVPGDHLISGGASGKESAVQSLGREDSLEESIATHSSILAGKIPWTEEPAGLQSMESQKVRHD